eukprot:7837708-Alexandrium_andersonii.AAC.1
MGEELAAGGAPAERLRLGLGSRPSSPGGVSSAPPDMARRRSGVRCRFKVPERWRVPPLRYHQSAGVRS